MAVRAERFACLAVLALAAGAAFAAAQDGIPAPPAKTEEPAKPAGTTFHLGVYEKQTNVIFESETTVETIHGITHSLKGTAALDFAAGTGTVDLSLPVAALRTGIDPRDGHMRSDGWLDAEKFPDITFKTNSLKRTKSDEASKKETWAYEGAITIHGVTKDLKGEATIQRVPEELGAKLGRGSWIKVKTAFQVALKDFAIEVPEKSAASVSQTWDIKVDIYGTTVLPEPKKE